MSPRVNANTVVVSVEVANFVPSFCEVAVMVVTSFAPPLAPAGMVTLTTMFAPTPALSGPIGVGVVVVQALPPGVRLKVSIALPVLVIRRVCVTTAPALPVLLLVAGVNVTLRTVFAVVVNVALAFLLVSPCEVPVMITLALAPPEAFDGICTVVVTTRLAPDASELIMVGVTVVV